MKKNTKNETSVEQPAEGAARVTGTVVQAVSSTIGNEVTTSATTAESGYSDTELEVDTDTEVDKDTLEQIAEAYHQVWYKERKDQGWRYGKTRVETETGKLNPCLVRYENLPDSEKQLLRQNARLAYVIMKNRGLLKEDDHAEIYQLTWKEWRDLMASKEEIGSYDFFLHHIDSDTTGKADSFIKSDSQVVTILKKIGLYDVDKGAIIRTRASINRDSCLGTQRMSFVDIDHEKLVTYLDIWLNAINKETPVVIIDSSKINHKYLAFNIFSLLDALEYLIGQDNRSKGIITKTDFEEVEDHGMVVTLSYFWTGNHRASDPTTDKLKKHNPHWPSSRKEDGSGDATRTGMKEFLWRLARSGAALVARKTGKDMLLVDNSELRKIDADNSVLPQAVYYECELGAYAEIFKIFIPYEQYESAFKGGGRKRVADLQQLDITDDVLKTIFPGIRLETKGKPTAPATLFEDWNAVNVLIVDMKLADAAGRELVLSHNDFNVQVYGNTPDPDSLCFENITVIILHAGNPGAFEFYKKIPCNIQIIMSSTAPLNKNSTSFESNGFTYEPERMKLPDVGLRHLDDYREALQENGALYGLITSRQTRILT